MVQQILVVDDDPNVCGVLKEIITTYGHKVTTAMSAREAVRILARERIHLIFLDIKMPEIQGDELLGFLRKRGAETPVVVVSAFVDEELAARLERIGVSGIVSKPFEVESIIDQMETALGKL